MMIEKQFLITEDGSHTLYIPNLDETYHSTHGAIQESNYVFVEQGLDFYLNQYQEGTIKMFEVGLGTGLNVLLSLIYAKKHGIYISYQSIEPYPLIDGDIQKLNYPDLVSENLAKEIFEEIHTSPWEVWNEISPDFRLKKSKSLLQNFESKEKYNLCFFDAFAPSKQPEMWRKELLKKIHSGLYEGGVFVTYCAQGQLKRDLKDIGFEVETLEGPPGKKEMVRAIKT